MLLALAAGLVNKGGVCKDSVFVTEYAKAFDPNRGYGGSAEKVQNHPPDCTRVAVGAVSKGPLPALASSAFQWCGTILSLAARSFRWLPWLAVVGTGATASSCVAPAFQTSFP